MFSIWNVPFCSIRADLFNIHIKLVFIEEDQA